jgi:two-component system, sensor histidine kinase
MKKTRTYTMEVLVRRLLFWPATLLSLLVLFYSSLIWLYDSYQEQGVVAQRLADILAIAAANSTAEGGDISALEAQIEEALKTPMIQSVRFIPIQLHHPSHTSLRHTRLVIKCYAPVEVLSIRQAEPLYHLTGYVEVTIDVKQRWAQLWMSKSWLWSFMVLIWLLYALISWYWARQSVQPLRRINQYIDQLRHGNAIELLDRRGYWVIQETQHIERNVKELSAQIKSLKMSQKTLSTEMEQLKQRERLALASRDDFQSMITHELKTPLNAIWGGVQLLRADQQLTPSQADSLKMIGQGSQQLSRLLDQVLAMLSLDQGRVVLHIEQFNPQTLLKQLMDESQRQLQGKAIGLSMELIHEPVVWAADLSKVKQILNILLDNAIKFTEQGQIHLKGWIERTSDQREWWCCMVDDTGIGIDAVMHQEIFKPFVQVDSSQNRRYEGAGMGLALAQRLTKLMDGQLIVESELAQGACFTLKLPLGRWQETQPDQQMIGKKVIVYEAGGAGELVSALSTMGLNVRRVISAEDVITMCQHEHIDALVAYLDVNPDLLMDLLQSLRHHEQYHHTVVIQMIKPRQTVDRLKGHRQGVDHWLYWPSGRAEMMRLFVRWIG